MRFNMQATVPNTIYRFQCRVFIPTSLVPVKVFIPNFSGSSASIITKEVK